MQDKINLIKLASERKNISMEQARIEIDEIFKNKKSNYDIELSLRHYFETTNKEKIKDKIVF